MRLFNMRSAASDLVGESRERGLLFEADVEKPDLAVGRAAGTGFLRGVVAVQRVEPCGVCVISVVEGLRKGAVAMGTAIIFSVLEKHNNL